MIKPKPYKIKCTECGYSKLVKPKSDVMNPMDLNTLCPKCAVKMERIEESGLLSLLQRYLNR